MEFKIVTATDLANAQEEIYKFIGKEAYWQLSQGNKYSITVKVDISGVPKQKEE